MKNIINFIKNKTAFLAAVAVAAVVGGVTTAVVTAAIPDSNGQVNSCYDNTTKALKVADPAGSCATGETALSWEQSGWKAFGYLVNNDATLDANLSKNISSVTTFADSTNSLSGFCIFTDANPSLISVTRAYGFGDTPTAEVRTSSNADGQNDIDPAIDSECGTDAKAMIVTNSDGNGATGGIYFYMQ